MKPITTTFLLLFTLCFTYAQNIELDKFYAISVSGGHQVKLISSDSDYAEVEMLKGDIDDVEVKVSGNTLKVKTQKSGWKYSKAKAKVLVYYSGNIEDIDVSSGSSLSSMQTLSSKDLKIEASSGASCDVEVEAEKLRIDVSSGARITVEGEAKQQRIDVSSGAKYNGKNLRSEDSRVDASSGAKAVVYCTSSINAEASSGAKVEYYGNPKKKDLEASKYSGGKIVSK